MPTFNRGTRKQSRTTIKGEKEFLENLVRIVRETNGQALLEPLIRASEPMKDEASDNAPFDTGALEKGIGHEVIDVDQTMAHIVIGPHEKQFYGLFQELGSNPHQHSQPFLRPAFDGHKRKVAKNMSYDVWQVVKGAVRPV